MNRRELGPDNPGGGGRGDELRLLARVCGRVRRGGEPARRGRLDPARGAGRGSPQLASTLDVQATLFVARRQYDEALDVASQSLVILEPRLPADHWLIAMARNVKGAALTGLGRIRRPRSSCSRACRPSGARRLPTSPRADARGWLSYTSPGASRKKPPGTPASASLHIMRAIAAGRSLIVMRVASRDVRSAG